MPAFTLRIDDTVSKELDFICDIYGYSKTGLMKSLLRDFLKKQRNQQQPKPNLSSLVGCVDLGGDALGEAGEYFE